MNETILGRSLRSPSAGDHTQNREALDAVKGVLIIAVVLGHSILAESLLPGLKTAVYSFHVQGFLLFPFLFPAPVLSCRNTADILVRYLVPYVYAVVGFSVFQAMTSGGVGLGTWILDVLKALVTGNANDLKQVTGFYLFWFLPVLFVTAILKMLYFTRRGWLRFAVAACAIAAHLLLPTIPWSLKQRWAFFGTHIALFVFPLGLSIHYGAVPLSRVFRGRWRFLLFGCFVLSFWLLLSQGLGTNLGNLGYASYRDLSALILQDGVAVLAFLTLLIFGRELAKIPLLSEIGNKSMAIYLLSQLFVVGTVRVFSGGISGGRGGLCACLLGSLSVVCGIIAPLLIAWVICGRTRLRSMVFPRSLRDLLFGFGIKTQQFQASGVSGA